jgi:hypothetical protein
MKHLIITACIAVSFAACTTKEKETSTESTTEPAAPTVVHEKEIVHDNPPAQKEEDKSRFEMSLSDTGSGIKVRVP